MYMGLVLIMLLVATTECRPLPVTQPERNEEEERVIPNNEHLETPIDWSLTTASDKNTILFQGDLLLKKWLIKELFDIEVDENLESKSRMKRGAIYGVKLYRLWPNGIINYHISTNSFTEYEEREIHKAIQHIQNVTCLYLAKQKII